MDRIICDNCGWELRASDLNCSFCGSPQRRAAAEPGALGITSPAGDADSGFAPFSPGRIELRNLGKHSFRVLAVAAPDGLELTAEPPLKEAGGFVLAVNAALQLRGDRNAELPPGDLRIRVLTSIGSLQLPVRSQPAPPLRLSQRAFKVPRGKPGDVRSELSLVRGVERVQLATLGAGLTLVEPLEEVRLEEGKPQWVVMRADLEHGRRAGEEFALEVQLADGVRLRAPLTFEEAAPGRLLLASGAPYVRIRAFPGERLERDLELINDGVLHFTIEELALRTDAGGEVPGMLPPRFVDAAGRTLKLPWTVPPGASVAMHLESDSMPASGMVGGAVVARTEAGETFQLPLRIDASEPPKHPFPVGLDFGTSVSAVATRSASQQRVGQVASIRFGPDGAAGSYLPSDVEIVDAPEKPAPALQIDWSVGSSSRHLAYARNLKRRVGLSGDKEETVAFRGHVVDIQVSDMAAFVVGEMKRQSELWLGARINRAVATVPTRFSLRRVTAIREIYERAGLRLEGLIDEAVAAGILGMYNQFQDRKSYTMLVYDMGGGTTDVTLFKVDNERVDGFLEIRPTVRGVAGDAGLGGRDVTDWMVRRVLDSLPPADRQAVPWPGEGLAAPEVQQLARRNQNDLFLLLEKAKLKLSGPEPLAELRVTPVLWDRAGKALPPSSQVVFTGTEVEEAFRPRLVKLWREVLDMVLASGLELDVLYFAGRAVQLPFVRSGLPAWLTAEGRFPKLQVHLPQDRDGNVVLKEAVSLGACLSLDLVDGIDERLVLENLDDRSASRFGLRDQRGDFVEILPANWRLGQPSERRVRIRLGTRFRSTFYEAHVEVWENPTRNQRIDGNPEAELIGTASLTYPVAELDPSRLTIEIGLVLREDRRMTLLAWHDNEVKEVPVEP